MNMHDVRWRMAQNPIGLRRNVILHVAELDREAPHLDAIE
jgi:hypothetical protein